MATTPDAKIILAIYTSHNDVPRTIHLYNTYWKDHIPSNIQIVLVYEGQGTGSPYTFINGTQEQPQQLVLDTRLTHRPLEMFRAIRTQFPTMIGCFKCDDTVIPNVLQLQGLLNYIQGSNTIDYLGKVNPESGVCCSPMYYLSRRAIVFLDTLVPKTDVRRTVDFGSYAGVGTREVEALDILEHPIQHTNTEIIIADHLRKMGVSPDDYNQLYSENIQDMSKLSVNLIPYRPLLYVKIDGGIGNQLFQIASAYGIAKRAGMEMAVIAYGCHSTHIPNPYDYFQTIFKNVPHIYHNRLTIQQTFQEPERVCWSYLPDIVTTMGAQACPTMLKGYFQNLSYFREYQDDIRAMFLRQDILNGLTKRFDSDSNKSLVRGVKPSNLKTPEVEDRMSLAKSYFLHIRRGDYVNNKRYWIDSDKYYRAAIDHILVKDPHAHFYVFSNDIEYCKQYHVLGSYQDKTFVDNLNEVESLYLMSLCQRGGICANSTYSWWGAYLNSNPEKTVIFPKRWFNLPGWPFDDIFLEGSVVLDA